ncbi:MAG TPA: F0F1 ATP synthase subunit A, partial [Brevundimonas sp.]|nr:F0F1 ATP synthase subunit A [Brevundimonas sp.]
MADPMEQFEVKPVVEIAPVNVPGLGLVDLSITNSTVAMFVAATIVVLFFAIVTASPKVVPGRLQVVGEGMFSFIDDLATGIIGSQ